MEDLFEKATRKKLRWSTSKGNLSVEDLWDLSLTQLNSIAKAYHREIKESEVVDFLDTKTEQDRLLRLRFDIVLLILETKKLEKQKAEQRLLRKQKKDKILNILKEKEDEGLKQTSEEDLKKMLAELDD